MKRYLCLLVVMWSCFWCVPSAMSSEDYTASAEKSFVAKILANGIVRGSSGRIIYLEMDSQVCPGQRSFYVRSKSKAVRIKKGDIIWFWVEGNCSGDNVEIDIVQKP